MIYDCVGAIRDPLKQDLAPEFYRNQKKSSVFELKLISTMIRYTIQETIFPIFFSPGDSHTRGMFFLLHLGLECVTEVDTDPKERFVSFKVSTCNEISLFLPLQGIATGSSWLGWASLKDYIYAK